MILIYSFFFQNILIATPKAFSVYSLIVLFAASPPSSATQTLSGAFIFALNAGLQERRKTVCLCSTTSGTNEQLRVYGDDETKELGQLRHAHLVCINYQIPCERIIGHFCVQFMNVSFKRLKRIIIFQLTVF